MRKLDEPLTPLQEKLLANTLRRLETAKQEMLGPVFAMLEARNIYFTYEANPSLVRHLWDSVEPLHDKRCAARLAHIWAEHLAHTNVRTVLETFARNNSLEGPVHIYFIGGINSLSVPTHADASRYTLGFITCDLGDAIPLVAEIRDAKLEIARYDGLVIAGAARNWAIWVENHAIALNVLP